MSEVSTIIRKWLGSRAVWGIVILFASAKLHAIGLNIGQGDAGTIAEIFTQLADVIGTDLTPDTIAVALAKAGEAAGAAWALYGRAKAQTPLPVTPTQVRAQRALIPPPTP